LARSNCDGNLEESRDVLHVTNNNRGGVARGDHMEDKQATATALKGLLEVDVLVIDDSDASADLTLLAIRDAAPHARIVRFHDATKALRFVFLAESSPKLVLLELGHPFHRGLHVIERLRSNSRMSAIPVIVLTATRDQSAVEASHALGANGFITKPDTREDYCSHAALRLAPGAARLRLSPLVLHMHRCPPASGHSWHETRSLPAHPLEQDEPRR
jgi:PleD family two-component response regulator